MQTTEGSGRGSARGLAQRLKEDSRQQIESRKRSAADQIDEIAHALGRAGEQLEHQPTLAAYTEQFAHAVSNVAARIREGSFEELVDDARQLARRNPGMFILGSFAAGVTLARFLKASSESSHGAEYSAQFGQAEAAQPDQPSREYSAAMESSAQSSSARGDESGVRTGAYGAGIDSGLGRPQGSRPDGG
ncbi:MAG TPA: hypothetical protein VK025_11930 [Steroidobacter sp.]|jgi:hypothetical protein|nr:hypothetical protein [Steroidobacteraceae bacterium]HLS82102.1 hypothetical protein [Steroidobacter sp.]